MAREVSISEEEQIHGLLRLPPVRRLRSVCWRWLQATVKGESAIIDLQPMADRLVYPAGGWSRVRSSMRVGRVVFMDLVQFLKTLVEQRLSVGMIPRVDA